MSLMPSYFFHLAFELYPYPQEHTGRSEDYQGNSYLPPSRTDIFCTFSALNKHCPKGKRESHFSTPGRLGPSKGDLSVLKDEDTQKKTIPIRDSVHAVRGGNTTLSPAGDAHERRSDTHRTDLQILRSAPETQDWRSDRISIESIDMTPVKTRTEIQSRGKSISNINDGIGAGSGGLATKGRYLPSEPHDTDVGWGIVHLYRDAEETPGLYDDEAAKRSLKGAGGRSRKSKDADTVIFKEEECTTLCILAVPSYLTPSDFLGFVGEKTRDEVTHFRMIRSAKVNRYMVLMKFKSAKKAREWRKEWNGKVFNSMEVSLVFPGYRHHAARLGLIASPHIARELSCRLHQICRIPDTGSLLRCFIISRYDERSIYTLHFEDEYLGAWICGYLICRTIVFTSIISHDKTFGTSYAFADRAADVSSVPRTHGRDNWSAYNTLPACVPLCLSAKVERQWLPCLPLYPRRPRQEEPWLGRGSV